MWNYESVEDLEDGSALFADEQQPFKPYCVTGDEQSPVDIRESVHAAISSPKLNWPAQICNVQNNGHTIEATPTLTDSYAELEKRRFVLKQFHFHAPSEHTISGSAQAMEVHFVHEDHEKALLVVGVLMREGAANKAFAELMDAIPNQKCSEQKTGAIDLTDFLPKRTLSRIYRYEGSLTTDPYREVVIWAVCQEVVEADKRSMGKFIALYPKSARPVQELHGRLILSN